MDFKTKKTPLPSSLGASLKVSDNPNFRSWFGDSKIVDEMGRPLVVYHGTPCVFDEVDTSKTNRLPGFWVTPDAPLAASYASGGVLNASIYPNGAAIMPLYAKVEKPYRFDPSKEPFSKAWETYLEGDFDGFIEFGNDSPGVMTINVKSAFQVKSATGNNGIFDPANPSLLG